MPRLTTIYTRTGDDGTTGLVGNRRVSKDSPRLEAFGTVDELNSAIGLARSVNRNRRLDTILATLQNDLFSLGAELATPPELFVTGMPQIGTRQIAALEKLLDELNQRLGPLQEFVLPAGCQTAATLHVARTVCRRAERSCVRLAHADRIGGFVVPYLNRLSDTLFMLARLANRQAQRKESSWKK